MDHMHVDVPLAGWKTDLDLGLYYSDTAGPQTIDGAGIWAQLELAPELRRTAPRSASECGSCGRPEALSASGPRDGSAPRSSA